MMRASLPFREAFYSGVALVIMVAMVSVPILVGFSTGALPAEVVPSGVYVTRHRANATVVTVPGVVVNPGRQSSSCIKLNVTAIRLGLIGYYSQVCGLEFILAGVLASFIVGQSLEYKYFFLEVLLTKSRLRAFMSRYGASLLGAVFASLLASLTASVVPYMSSAYASLTQCYLICSGLLLLASLSGTSFGALASLGLRSVSGGIIATLGFTGLMAMLSVNGSTLRDFVIPLFVAGYDPQGAITYVSLLALVNALSLWRVVRVEY